MMGERQVRQEGLFYGFSLEEHAPADHPLRAIGRPPVGPELTIRMLPVGHCRGIRSERRPCGGAT